MPRRARANSRAWRKKHWPPGSCGFGLDNVCFVLLFNCVASHGLQIIVRITIITLILLVVVVCFLLPCCPLQGPNSESACTGSSFFGCRRVQGLWFRVRALGIRARCQAPGN